jgi:serine phosphatase RsbU (regulator of sigma subunit)
MYLRREMELAREVQQAMLPKRAPELAGFTAVGWSKAASVTGGDCYDLFKLADGRLGIFLGDASGHGVGPALIVSQVRTLVRAMADRVSRFFHPTASCAGPAPATGRCSCDGRVRRCSTG